MGLIPLAALRQTPRIVKSSSTKHSWSCRVLPAIILNSYATVAIAKPRCNRSAILLHLNNSRCCRQRAVSLQYIPSSLHSHSTGSQAKMMPTKSRPYDRTYEQALTYLNELQSNQSVVSMVSTPSDDMDRFAIPEMLHWLERVGYTPKDFNKFRVIHVAGTKGKGSVCAMIDSILRQYLPADTVVNPQGKVELGRVGVYTSPHLVTPRERIRLDGQPISKELFTKYFFEIWERFTASAQKDGHPNPNGAETKPNYFRFLTIMALHTFWRENVQTVIMECGIGGEYDSTNILQREAKTTSVITSLGIDHVGMLGDTIGEIAWHKAGIMREGVPCFTVRQPEGAIKVLQERANDVGTKLTIVNRRSELVHDKLKLNLEGDFQKDNASLAIVAANSHLKAIGFEAILEDESRELPIEIHRGLTQVSWPGRCQVIHENNIEWLIDGAHTNESISEVARWYAGKLDSHRDLPGMLIFNSQLRDASKLAVKLYECLHEATKVGKLFQVAAFTTNTAFTKDIPEPYPDLTLQRQTADAWAALGGSAESYVYGGIEEAVEEARRIAQARYPQKLQVLVTGSLHLVGGFLEVMGYEG